MQNFLHSFNQTEEEIDAGNAGLRDHLDLMLAGYPEPTELSHHEEKAFRTMFTRDEVEAFFDRAMA